MRPAIVAAVVCMLASASAVRAAPEEYALKAAYLYNSRVPSSLLLSLRSQA
jgi:hypothetical protein